MSRNYSKIEHNLNKHTEKVKKLQKMINIAKNSSDHLYSLRIQCNTMQKNVRDDSGAYVTEILVMLLQNMFSP